jgi:hypothetical protein
MVANEETMIGIRCEGKGRHAEKSTFFLAVFESEKRNDTT